MIMGQAKWTTNHTKVDLHPKKVMLYIWWDWKGVLDCELLLENQTINSNKCCSQLGQLKGNTHGKVSQTNSVESVNTKHIIFHQENIRPHVFFVDQEKTVTVWLGSFDSSAVFTRHCTFRFTFILVFIKLMENFSTPWKTVRGTWNSSLLKKKKF